MTGNDAPGPGCAELVLPCEDLDATIRFFRETLGFRLDMIFPADAPRQAVISGHGLSIRLDGQHRGSAARIRIELPEDERRGGLPGRLIAPNGAEIDLVPANAGLDTPALQGSVAVTHSAVDADWHAGRAGMQYRDLIPGRLGGAWIASHIRIPAGGPVPDYVHYHEIRFQLIFCRRGWARLVYEDQGEPFVMRAGDGVLQPPRIRHRVLECSDGFEVVELGSPAEHVTLVEHGLELPTGTLRPDRDFGGQRFVFHNAAVAGWSASPYTGLEQQDTGIAEATGGIASVRVLRPANAVDVVEMTQNAEFLFRFVLDGSLTLAIDDERPQPLEAGTAFVIPAGHRHAVQALSDDLRMLEVTSPA